MENIKNNIPNNSDNFSLSRHMSKVALHSVGVKKTKIAEIGNQ